jgi:hypothetical protein
MAGIPGPALGEAARRMLRSVENRLDIPLGGLSADEVAEMAAALTAGSLDSDAVQWLYHGTGGHPLYLRTVLSEGSGFDPQAPGHLALPRSLAAAVGGHLRMLPPETRSIVEMLSVLNLRLPLAQLGQAAQVDSPGALIEPAVPPGWSTDGQKSQRARWRSATLTLGQRTHGYLALAQYLAGDWDDALLTAEQGLSTAAIRARRFDLPLLYLAAACVPAGRGQAEEAERHTRLAERVAASLDYRQERLYAAMARALICQASGDYLGMADALGYWQDDADRLSGCHLSVHDDPDAVLACGPDVRDRHQLRLASHRPVRGAGLDGGAELEVSLSRAD